VNKGMLLTPKYAGHKGAALQSKSHRRRVRPDACDVLCCPILSLYSSNRIKTREILQIRYKVGVVYIPPTQTGLNFSGELGITAPLDLLDFVPEGRAVGKTIGRIFREKDLRVGKVLLPGIVEGEPLALVLDARS